MPLCRLRRLLVVLLVGGAVPSCGGAPPTVPPSRLESQQPWKPAPGVKMVECDAPSSVCRRDMPAACEEACSDGDMESCVALARWDEGPPADEEEVKLRQPMRARELYRLACEKGFGWGCHALVQSREASPGDRALATTMLAPSCDKDPVCGCFLYGDALSLTPGQEKKGLAVLDGACVRGALPACDTTELWAEICARQPEGGACDVLRAQKRVPPLAEEAMPPPQWSPATLPAAFLGCFRVMDAEGEHAALASGTIHCFTQLRHYVKPAGGSWDEAVAKWMKSSERVAFRDDAFPESIFEVSREGNDLQIAIQGFYARIERLPPPEAARVEAEANALPDVGAACRRAMQCVGAMPYGYDGMVPETLRTCEALERQARQEIERAHVHEGYAPPMGRCP